MYPGTQGIEACGDRGDVSLFDETRTTGYLAGSPVLKGRVDVTHEIGHLECGHLDNKNIHGLLVDEQLEIEADCYALQFSSKRDLRNACYKLMEIRFGIKERWRAAVQFFAPQWRRGLRLMF